MNILTVCYFSLYKQFSSSFVHAQAAAYAALGHRVRVIVPYAIGKRDWDGIRFSGPIRRWIRDGVEIYLVRYVTLSKYGEKGFNLASAYRTLSGILDKLLDGFVPDVIHAHTLGFVSDVGAFLKERLGVPLVVTTHGSDASILVEQGRLEELRRYCGKADMIVAVSSVLAGKIRSCGTTVPVASVLNGFRTQNLPKGGADRTASLAQAGNLIRQKRPHVTLQAFARLLETRSEMVLTFIGQGPEQGPLEEMSQELGVSRAVRFLGQLPNSEVLAEFARTRFFVMPSVREGFGIVYLEAMASGCVTIGTEGEGIADLIISGENGFLVPPDDPEAIVRTVEWCLMHPGGTEDIAEKGRRNALELTWEKNASQYINMFMELI